MRAYLNGFMDGFGGTVYDMYAHVTSRFYARGWKHGARCAGWGWL